MDDLNKDVENFFQGYAENFDAIYGHTKKRNFFQRWIDRRLRRVMRLRFEETLANSVNPDIKSILDIGCGSGRYCVEFLRQGKRVAALDMAEGMLQIARKACASISGEKPIEFIKANYLEYEFREKFDAACLMGLFDYIENPIALFEKLKRDISKEIYASFPKSSGLLAFIRRIRYRLRKCPLFMYTWADIEEIMTKTELLGKYEVVDCERDYFLKIDPPVARPTNVELAEFRAQFATDVGDAYWNIMAYQKAAKCFRRAYRYYLFMGDEELAQSMLDAIKACKRNMN